MKRRIALLFTFFCMVIAATPLTVYAAEEGRQVDSEPAKSVIVEREPVSMEQASEDASDASDPEKANDAEDEKT